MMYNSKLAVALKSHGKVLREFGETVYVPFGNEYSIFIKNMNNVRALISVEIDGEDVGDGTQFVVNGNSSVDLQRFLKNGNLNEGNSFKFLERTENIEDHRGVGVEDGLIRVEFQFERKPVYRARSYSPYNDPWGGNSDTFFSSSTTFTASSNISLGSSDVKGAVNVNHVAGEPTMDWFETPDENDAGITVPGSLNDQQFHTVASFPVEAQTHVIVLKMLGQTEDNVRVRKPVTVKSKPTCTSCGLRNKATAKFCTECGTSLQLVQTRSGSASMAKCRRPDPIPICFYSETGHNATLRRLNYRFESC